MLVDTHCHIFSEYYDDIEEVIMRAKDAGVKAIIVNGVDRKSNEEILELVKKYDIVYGALGIQPQEVDNCDDDDILFIDKHINADKIVFIQNMSSKITYSQVSKIIDIIEETKRKIRSNCNFNISIQVMALNIYEVIKWLR